jgi:hypothetical protein
LLQFPRKYSLVQRDNSDVAMHKATSIRKPNDFSYGGDRSIRIV